MFEGKSCYRCIYHNLNITTLPSVRASNYANVLRTATVYCRKKRKVINEPWEQCKSHKRTEPKPYRY